MLWACFSLKFLQLRMGVVFVFLSSAVITYLSVYIYVYVVCLVFVIESSYIVW